MSLTIQQKTNDMIPIEAEVFRPDTLASKTIGEIRQLAVYHGNQLRTLGECFELSGDASDENLVFEGDFSRVKCIGQAMRSGSIRIQGNVGMHVGAEMRGGSIEIHGNAGDWVGAEMRGGFIRVDGDVGHLAGGSYRGNRSGMKGGTILIEGSAGNEIGCGMRRGLLVVAGTVGDFAGFNMLAGTIVVSGGFGIRTGAGMRRGSIISLGKDENNPVLLSTFRYDCLYCPQFLSIYFRQLLAWGVPVDSRVVGAKFRRYSGDLVTLGKGEILVLASSGSGLSS